MVQVPAFLWSHPKSAKWGKAFSLFNYLASSSYAWALTVDISSLLSAQCSKNLPLLPSVPMGETPPRYGETLLHYGKTVYW